jgi:glycosyltransferase involved in cell wall biosynthesis
VARVALVCEPPDGGVAEHVVHLALGLPEHGHNAVVLCPPDFRLSGALRSAGCPVLTLDLRRDYGRPLRDLAAVGTVARALRRQDVDLVHAHSAKAGVIGRLAALVAGKPVVYTPHCFGFVGDVSRAQRVLALTVERALARVTAAIVCVCEDEREVARAHGVGADSRLTVIHNGCPACPPGLAADARLRRHAAGGPLAGAVAVLRRQKSLEVLLDAVPAVLAQVPDARFAIVGDGPEHAALTAHAATLGLADDARLVFLPFEGPSERHISALDVYVLPSAWEAFPIGVLEALACGVPQIATDVGGTREAVVGDTGILVPPRDPAALADALVALLRDPGTRRKMAEASRTRHEARFGLEPMLGATAELYARVLGDRADGLKSPQGAPTMTR